MHSPSQALDNFIISRIYQKMRNPMYVGYFLVILAEFFLIGYILILVFFIFMIILVHLLVVFMEEPSLKKAFGKQYEDYIRKVPRWFPNLFS